MKKNGIYWTFVTLSMLLLTSCATEYPSGPTAEEYQAYKDRAEQKDSDKFFGRRRYKIGPVRFGPKAEYSRRDYDRRFK